MKTKSLLQTFLTLLALMTCLFMRPDIAKAQTSVPYYTSVGGEYLPTGWIADHYGVTYQGTYYYAFNTGHIILPEFNVPTNTLTVDVRVEPFYDPPFGSSFEIGYLTDVNNLSTFHSVELFTYIDEPWDDGWKWKRAVLTDVPANARIAFYAFYRWSISDVRVYETPDPIDVPYTLTFNSQNLQPEGWYANNYDVYSNERFFQTGTAVLPQFTSNLSTLQLDLSFKPRNSTAQSIEIGFVNSNDNFTPLNTYTYSSAWTGFEPKRVKYYGSLSGCRMAIRCTGEWCFQGVRVTTKNTPLYNIPYQPSFDMFQPEGWVAENYMYSEEAYFLSGVAYLPQFSSNLNTLQLNLDLKPKDATAQSIEFGYINSNNSFVPLKVYDNSSSWTSYDTKTVVYSNAPSDGRMAFRCYGKWCIDNMIVQSLPSPTIVPYTANLYSHTPAGWIAENYHHYGNTNVPYSWLSTGCAILPQFNYPINSLQLDICIGPLNSDAQNISLGYVTNPNDPSTFTAIRTYYYENTFTPKRIYFTGSIPTDARMAILCNGEWKIDHVHVEVPPTSLSVPYDATINNNMLPLGWIADNYYSFNTNHARLSPGCTILPQFNVALNTLQLDICLSSISGAQNISIGYVTNSNPSTFTAIKTYTPSWEGYQPKRISFNVSGVPSNARMAIYCNGDWVIGNIHVEVPTTTYAVPYSATLGSTSQPEGWAADNYCYSSSGAYLSTGCAILPQFNTSIGSLEMDIALKPKNSSAQSILIGYVTNNNPSTFTALQAYSALSSWSDYLPKRILYSGVPSGAQMAIYCNGDWGLGGVEVKTIQSTSTSFDVPYHATFTPTELPEGWIVSNYYYSGNAYLTTGCAILPQFNANLNTLLLDIMVKPKNTNAQSIQVGYVTNNSASTFVPLQTFSNSSSWGLYQPKRVLYNVSGLPSGARMAIRCNGEWYINDASVYSIPQPFAVPYSLPSTMGYEQPEGWIANNYGYNSTPRFTNGCALLPKFNVPVNALNMHLSFRYENGDSPSLSVGYVTNDNPSTFTPLWTHTQTTGGWRYFDVFLGGAPANSRIAIRCEGSWTIDIVDITMPTLSVPYTQDFQDIAIGSLPQGWTAANMSVQNGNTSYKRLQGTDFAVLTYFDNAELNSLQLDFRCRPSIMNYGGMIRVGYIPSGGSLNNFVGLTTLDFQTYWTDYRDMNVAFSDVPAGARLAFQCIPYGNGNEWMIDDVHIYSAGGLPFTEPFATSNLPQGWSTYLGDLNWDPVATTYTDVTMTPSTSVWNFGTKNGVFDSHAYTVLGANSNEHKWLVSPPVILGNADNVYLTFDLGLTRQSGNQVPVTPGAQDEELILVMISNDGGYTWHFARGWSSEMDGLGDLNYLHPDGDSYYHSLNTYRNQTVQVAFYVECTNGSNATNNVHIDNVSIQSYDFSAPPVTVTVSEIGGYSAKVQWTAVYPMQNDWDVCVCAADLTTPPTNLIVHRHGYKWCLVENLEEATQYKAWVRYNDGNGTTSNWICSEVFETLMVNHPIPFAEPFATSSAPYGWSTYYGDLHWDPTIFTYTDVEMMPSNNAWQFGQQNGIFDSHAYTLLGANSYEHKWLVSPPVKLGNADNVCLTFDLGMTRQSGNQVPITYGEQVEQRIFVMISNDGGNTWHIVRGWCGEITSWGGDINNLDPEGDNYYCSLNAYRNQIIQVAFYAECSDGSTPENNVHVDNVSIQSYDFTAPPISVTASDIGGYSAKVSWTSTYPMQINWDVCVCEAWATTPTGPIVQLRDYGLRYYQVQGLEEATQYKAWVRYNDGTTTGNWRCSDVFETLMITHPIPFDEPFATSSAPYGWATYVGALNESNGVYTATLTPNTDYSWTFGQQNGVFDSHAYAMMGNTSGNERRWLVSPPINLGGANDVFFSFDLALSNATGNQVPVTSGEQDHQRVAVLVTNDDGDTWHLLAGWSGVMTGWSDLNALTPQGSNYYYSLSAYRNQTVKVAFYAECTNSGDATNHVHIDNVGIQSQDMSAAPSTVSVSEVSLHSAKVSWTAAAPAQASQPHWDVCVCDYWYETPPTELIVHRDGYMWYNYTGLTEGTEYRAWVRYNNGNTISDWTRSSIFVTEMDCAAPTNVQVTTTMYNINISWEPGQSNQTSWMVTIWGGGEEWESDVIETTSYVFDATNLLMPGETFLVSVMGYCEDGDGWASTDWVHAQMQDYPTLTVNEGQDWSSEVVILMDHLGYTESWSQFIIPSEMLTDLQFSTINQLRFVCDKGYTEWNNEVFSVYLQEVDFDDFSDYCDYEFYGGEMSLFYQGTLSVGTNHIMTIDASWDDNLFHYRDKNLLVYIEQYNKDTNTQDPQFVWAGTDISDNVALAPYWHDQPYCVTFLPNTTFRYETDTYLPPTDFQAYVMSGYEVSFMWTPHEDQIATEIMICASPDFIGNSVVINSTESNYNADMPDFFEPETTYYYCYRGTYEANGEIHYSSWSTTRSFVMPNACQPPINLQVSDVGPFSAHVSWTSDGESDELAYRITSDNSSLNVVMQEGFDGCTAPALPSDWSTIKNGTGGSGWTVYSYGGHDQHYPCARSIARQSDQTDDWLITPQMELMGEFEFWAHSEILYLDVLPTINVYVSTTGTDMDDFELVYTYTLPDYTWRKITIDLSSYSGNGYIAIRHQCNPTNVTYLFLDDFSHSTPSWNSLGNIEGNQYDFNGLNCGVTYQVKVKSNCSTGYYSHWTESVTFSTPGNIVFADDNVKAICVDEFDLNGDNEISYDEAAAVTGLGEIFRGNASITSFNELQYFTGLTTIGANAFESCTSLSAITLPPTITSIGYNAFGSNTQDVGCTSLHSIIIPPSVTTIGDWAFQHSGLTEINLPYSVTNIGVLAFGYCNSLTSITLPATVTNIQGNAFTGASIASIEVAEGNPVYDSRNGCNAIIHTQSNTLITGCKNTVVPYGVTAIGVSAFESSANLTSITLPETVQSIGGWAFLWTGLTDITLPGVGETIGEYAFRNCSNLYTIEIAGTVPPDITQPNAFDGCPDMDQIHVYVPCGAMDIYTATDWNDFDLAENCNIVFEDYLTKELCVNTWDRNFDGELSYREAAAVTSIGNLFSEENITRFNELQYFTGLEEIADEAFLDCSQLVAVTLPPTVTEIKGWAFANCNSLTSLTLGENITDIGGDAFNGCEGLWFIKVENQYPPAVGNNAFNDVDGDIPVYVPCGRLSAYQNATGWNGFTDFIDACDTIHFADAAVRAICLEHWDDDHDGYLSYGEAAAVTSIGEFFRGRLDIQTFNELQYFTSLTEIGDNAFKGCAWLNTIELPATIASIGSLAFYNTGLVYMDVMPEAIRTIGFSAFGQCRNLTSIVIPASVNYIEGNPFGNCPALNNIWVYPSNPVYDSRNNCNAIIETATNTLVTGGKNTVIPDNVTALGSYAFSGQTALTSITLPASIASLGNGVFENCTGLTVVNVQAETPPTLGYNVFDGVPDDVVISIPCGTKEAYTQSWAPYAANLYDGCAYIEFADANVKAICVDEFDLNGDEEISYDEAAAVTGLGEIFLNNATITSFNELQYFTNVTSIDAYAFNGCRALTSITLPPAITSIGNYAFVSCQALTSLALPSTLTSIGSAAFGNCYALTTIEFPNGLTSIGSSAFMNSGLTSVAIPASVTDIGTNPFRSCSALESITVDPENPKYDSRDGCNAIIYTYTLGSNTRTILISGCKNTVIPDGVTAIYPYAFDGITELTSITLPGSLTSIGNYAFQNCTGLQSITVLANTPPYLGTTPFNQVDTGIPVYVPCHSIEDYQGASGWSNFTNIQARTDVICFEDDAVKAICVAHWDSDGDGEVSYAEVAYVYTLGTYFLNNTTITSFNELQYFVRLSDLTAYAFNGCSALESVTLPEGVVSISSYAFNGCTSLESITIPETTTQIWERAFFGCTSLESITIPNAVTTIGDHAFYGCIGLTDITIGERVSFMDQYVFGACDNLQSITVMADIPPTLEYGVFYQVLTGIPVYVPCGSEAAYQAADGWNEFTNYVPMPMDGFICFADPAVKDVCVAPETGWDTNGDGKLSYVEAYMVDYQTFGTVFQYNTDITTFDELQYFTGLTRIPNHAFDGCSNLTSVVLPAGLDWIGYNAFENCTSLAGPLVFPESVTHIGWEAFRNCESLTGELVLPPNLNFLGHSSFYHCTGLSGTLEFPTTLTEIQLHAFNGCSGITNLVLHEGINDIQGNAFAGCTGLTSITVLATTPPGSTVASAPFYGDDFDIPVYIPCGTKAAYQAHESWHNFTNFQYLNCPELASVFYLVEGWNWWAPVVEVTLEGDEGLAATLEGDAPIINSQDGGFLRYEVVDGQGSWSGTLSHTFTPGQMYKIYIESVSDEYEVTGIEVPEVTLTIVQGYNWFGYVGANAAVGDVFGSDFQPAVGDKIVNEAGNSATFDGTRWVGDLTNLYYGTAYIYYSNSSTPKTVVMTE